MPLNLPMAFQSRTSRSMHTACWGLIIGIPTRACTKNYHGPIYITIKKRMRGRAWGFPFPTTSNWSCDP